MKNHFQNPWNACGIRLFYKYKFWLVHVNLRCTVARIILVNTVIIHIRSA